MENNFVLSEEEREDIINAAVEKCLLIMPETIGNLIAHTANLHKLNAQFYKDHPEFRGYKDAVQSVIEMVEGGNPMLDYEEILTKSIPEIKKRIELVGKTDTENIPKKISRDFSNVDFDNNGVL